MNTYNSKKMKHINTIMYMVATNCSFAKTGLVYVCVWPPTSTVMDKTWQGGGTPPLPLGGGGATGL